MQDGRFKVGFEVNGLDHYVIKYQNSSKNATSIGMDIGQFGCTFNKSSRFNYKTATSCDGYFVRKNNW